MKRYKARTEVSVRIVLPNGESTRVSFMPQTGGGSLYYTEDTDIIHGLEHHSRYGKLFEEDADYHQQTAKKRPRERKKGESTPLAQVLGNGTSTGDKAESEALFDAGLEEEEGAEEESSENPRVKQVEVTDEESAKDYLAEHFDVVRTKMKTRKHIDETGALYGVEFVYV